MPSWRKFAGGKTLTAKALKGRKVTGKVEDCTVETLRSPEGIEKETVCLKVEGEARLVPMNSTNCTNLEEVYGEDFNNWIGKPVEVSTHKTKYMGKPVDGLLVLPMKLKRR